MKPLYFYSNLLQILLVTCFLCARLPQTAQAQQWEWVLIPQNANGAALRTNFYRHAADKTGNLYAVSQSEDTVNIGNNQLIKPFLTKFSPAGGVIWSKSIDFGNTLYNFIVHTIQCDGNENVYIAGYIAPTSTTDINFGNGNVIAKGNYFLAKYSPQGSCLWAKVIKGHSLKEKTMYSIPLIMAIDKQNNIYLSHNTDENYIIDNMSYTITPAKSVNGVLTKYNSEGTIQWIRKLYDHDNIPYYVAPLLKNLKIDSENNIVTVFDINLTATVLGTLITNNNAVSYTAQNIILAKTDNNLRVAWFKNPKSHELQFSYGLNIDNEDNILLNYFGDTHNSSVQKTDNLTIKYHHGGTIIWEKDVKTFAFMHNGAYSMVGNSPTHGLSTLNPATNSLLCAGYFGNENTLELENSLIVTPKTNKYTCKIDLLVASLAPEGKFQWALQAITDLRCMGFNDYSPPYLNEIVSSTTGHSYVVGYFKDSLQLNNTWYLNKNKALYERTFIAKIAQFCPEPALPISVETASCKPTKLSVPNCADCRFQWYKDAQPIAQATQNSYTAAVSGSYSVTIAKPTCMLRSEQVDVKVAFPELPAVIIGNTQRNLCRLSDTLRAKPVEGANYQWYRNGEKIGSNSPNLFINQSGAYTVALQKADCSITSISNAVVVNFVQIPIRIIGNSNTVFCKQATLQTAINNDFNSSSYQYEWRRNGQLLPFTSTPLVATESGSYTVTVRRDSCRGVSIPFTVQIVPNQVLTLLPLSNSTVCDSVTLFVKEKADSYLWTRNGQFLRYSQQPNLLVTESGSYQVRLGGANCTEFSAPIMVTVLKKPAVKLVQESPFYFCNNGLLAIDNPSPNLTYWWYKDGKHLPEANNQTILRLGAADAGIYQVEAKDKSNTCSGFSALVKVVSNEMKATLRPNSPTFFCERGLLQADSSSLFSYEWSKILPTGKQVVGNSPTLPITASGTYQLKVQQATCADSLTVSAVVYQFPSNLTIEGSASFICSNSPTTTIQLAATPIPTATYTWWRNGSLLPQTSATIQVSQIGTYTASVKLPNGCQKSIGQFVIRNQPPSLVIAQATLKRANWADWVLFPNPVIATLRLEHTEKNPLTVQILTPQPTWTNIKWQLNDKPLETATGKTVLTTNESGTYKVNLTDTNGCQAMALVEVEAPTIEEIQASIVDLLGRVVWQKTLTTTALQTTLSIEVGHLVPSIYLLYLEGAKDKVVKKFMKH